MEFGLAHIDALGAPSTWWIPLAAVVLLALATEHLIVKHGPSAAFRSLRPVGAAALAVSLLAVLAPTGSAQQGQLLPDLISDPPKPSFFNEIIDNDGTRRLVITFDGYIHNIGDGALDVVGNPQTPDGMRQRVRRGDVWEDVGNPTIRYETDDGHNHFHLMEVVEYLLWDEAQGAQTAIGSKVGFCLVDSEAIEAVTEPDYSEESDKFCQEGNPEATELRMGISPGWRDVYDATTTLQWVDVSDVAPGRYWIGAITDPNNEILESDEDNNQLIFSRRPIVVPGFTPRPQPPATATTDEATIELAVDAHGDVSLPRFRIERGPEHGTLDQPIGVDLASPLLTYRRSPGFSGKDRIVYSVRDAGSAFPVEPSSHTVEIQVAGSSQPVSETETEGEGQGGALASPTIAAPSTFFEMAVGEPFDLRIEATSELGEPVALYGRDLPPGLIIDPASGRISGAPLLEGIYSSELIAVDRSSEPALQPIAWVINPAADPSGLESSIDRSSPALTDLRVRLGNAGLRQRFEAQGLPPGLTIDEAAPIVTGQATELGTFDVIVEQFSDDGAARQMSFTWTIRPSTAIGFAL